MRLSNDRKYYEKNPERLCAVMEELSKLSPTEQLVKTQKGIPFYNKHASLKIAKADSDLKIKDEKSALQLLKMLTLSTKFLSKDDDTLTKEQRALLNGSLGSLKEQLGMLPENEQNTAVKKVLTLFPIQNRKLPKALPKKPLTLDRSWLNKTVEEEEDVFTFESLIQSIAVKCLQCTARYNGFNAEDPQFSVLAWVNDESKGGATCPTCRDPRMKQALMEFRNEKGMDLMQVAVAKGSTEAVEQLLKLGMSLDSNCSQGHGVFDYAVMYTDGLTALKYLLSKIPKEKIPASALILAARMQKFDQLEFLSNVVPDKLACRDADGDNALSIIVKSHCSEILEKVLKTGHYQLEARDLPELGVDSSGKLRQTLKAGLSYGNYGKEFPVEDLRFLEFRELALSNT